MIIAVDFDGTCVTHEYPRVGINIGAQDVLKELVANGHQLILFTMRSDIVHPTGKDNELYLSDALSWFELYEIPLYGIQTNPTQLTWTTSPKAYAELYIDDAALGCPLLMDGDLPYVDWKKVREMLIDKNIIAHNI